MRTLTSKLTMLFVALAIGFAACEKSPVEEQKPEPKPDPQPEVELTITSGTQEVVSFEGGEVVITYTLSGQSDTLPEAACDATWISDIAVAEGTITLNVAANETEESRQAWVKIEFGDKEQSVEIHQEPYVPQDTPPTEYNYTMASAERDDKVADPEFSIAFASEDGKTRLVAHFVGEAGDVLLESGDFSSQSGTIDLGKTMFKNEGGIVKLTDARATVDYIGTDDFPPSTRIYTINFTLTDADAVIHNVTYQGEVANIYQGPTGPEEFAPAKVVAVKSMIGNFFLQLYIDNTRYHELDLLDEIAPNNDYLSAGVYKYSDKTIGTYSTYNTGKDRTTQLEDAELQLSHNEAEGTSTIVGFIKSAEGHHITFDWTGVIEGFKFEEEEPEIPVDPNATIVEIASAKVNYDKAGQKQILFSGAEQSHQLYFEHESIAVSKPIPDGIYSLEDGTMNARYCLHDYGWTDGEMSDIVVQVKNTSENTTRFIASWAYDGKAYAFDWTGAVEGFVYEDVSGQRLDFAPTYVEIAELSAENLYIYFYDDSGNEMFVNYDHGKVYMPYINYEGSKLDIDATDYTFTYSDNGDGTYTYDARFVTLDGRTIEFSGALPTTVS
ncbi:MAG: BACON domain-containing protein [Alistipes sp.]|nr:BACON domain-containing protein [Alistipes sp.]